jgi:hypothetical protein
MCWQEIIVGIIFWEVGKRVVMSIIEEIKKLNSNGPSDL